MQIVFTRIWSRASSFESALVRAMPAARLTLVEPFQNGPRRQLSTDGWRSYRPCIEEGFGERADYGVRIKTYRASEQPGRYGPPELTDTERRVIAGDISPFEICTSHVERHNLSIRTFLRRFTRLALGFSKKLDNLAAVGALYVVHYNLARSHASLKKAPAMAAKIIRPSERRLEPIRPSADRAASPPSIRSGSSGRHAAPTAATSGSPSR